MIRFDKNGFHSALAAGVCRAPCLFSPLVRVSQRALFDLTSMQTKLKVKSFREHCVNARKRMDASSYADVRMAMHNAILASDDYFPAYRYFAGEFLNDEWLASVDWHKGFHRDHVMHQLMSVYVGNSLLSGANGVLVFGGRTLLDFCVDTIVRAPECAYLREYLVSLGGSSLCLTDSPLSRYMWRCMFLESYFLAALFHDCGYPWQFASNIESALSAHHPIQSPSDRGSDWTFENYRDRLIMYPLNGYQPITRTQPVCWTERCLRALQTGFDCTHGMPGAFALLYLNDLLREYPRKSHGTPIKQFCIDWAAMAIMMHDLEPLYSGDKGGYKHAQLRVSLKRDPLSFVLTLTDQIQDFCRPNAVFGRRVGNKVPLSYKAACHAVEIFRSGSSVKIDYLFSNLGQVAQNANIFKPDAMRQYFAVGTGYLDYSLLPLSAITLDARHEP